MGKLKHNQSGFGAIEALLIFIIVALIGFVGYYVYNAQKSTDETLKVSSNSKVVVKKTTVTTPKMDKTYTDPVGKFSVQYPATWKVSSDIVNTDPTMARSKTTITSPSGTVLYLKSDWGGRGGICEPAQGDKPFASGNECPTIEYFSIETLPINNVYYPESYAKPDGSTADTYKLTEIVLVTGHYGIYDEGVNKNEYFVGVDQVDPTNSKKVNDPKMGFIINEPFFTVYDEKGTFKPYIYAYAQGTNETFLKSDDASIVKAILRTMKVEN